jgi:hypothetical protein
MPILDLTDTRGVWDIFAPFKLWAVMLHPCDNEEKLRQEFLVASKAQWIVERVRENPSAWDGFKMYHITAEDLSILLQSLSFDTIMQRSRERARRGVVAGDLLQLMGQIALSDDPIRKKYGASLARATHILESDYRKAICNEAQGVRTSRKEIYSAWETHKPVAHFWAAYRHGQGLAEFLEPDGQTPWHEGFGGFPIFSQEQEVDGVYELLIFLLHAEAYRRFGVNNIPHGRGIPTLPHQTTWAVRTGSYPFPPEIELPPLSDPHHPLLWPLSEAQKAVLEQYKANTRF